MHFVSAFAGGQLMADPRLKSPDRWVGGVCRGMRLALFFFFLQQNRSWRNQWISKNKTTEPEIMLGEFTVFNWNPCRIHVNCIMNGTLCHRILWGSYVQRDNSIRNGVWKQRGLVIQFLRVFKTVSKFYNLKNFKKVINNLLFHA